MDRKKMIKGIALLFLLLLGLGAVFAQKKMPIPATLNSQTKIIFPGNPKNTASLLYIKGKN